MEETRKFTYKLLELIEEGAIDTRRLAEQLAFWVSEENIERFMRVNEYYREEEEDNTIH